MFGEPHQPDTAGNSGMVGCLRVQDTLTFTSPSGETTANSGDSSWLNNPPVTIAMLHVRVLS
jgi:hypothetical protein